MHARVLGGGIHTHTHKFCKTNLSSPSLSLSRLHDATRLLATLNENACQCSFSSILQNLSSLSSADRSAQTRSANPTRRLHSPPPLLVCHCFPPLGPLMHWLAVISCQKEGARESAGQPTYTVTPQLIGRTRSLLVTRKDPP